MADTKEKTWSPMRMLDLCYQASDVARDLITEQERRSPADRSRVEKLTALHKTLAQFTNEVQHVWDEYVELLDHLSDARKAIESGTPEAHPDFWVVRQLLEQHDYIIRTWDREDAS